MKKIKKKSSGSHSESAGAATGKKVMTTRERMQQRKKKLQERSTSGIIFPKEGTTRVRLVSQGPDKELGLEIMQFYLGKDLGSVISPQTFNEPCPFFEKYKELKESKDPDDQELAKSLVPKRRYLVAGTVFKDDAGREVDEDKIRRPILVPTSIYQGIVDLYLDEDDWGDMTDPKEGYDIKINRSGKGKNDTTYTVVACPRPKNPLDKKYIKELDLENELRKMMKPYDELEEILDNFLSGGTSLSDDDSSSKGKRRHGDI